MKSFLLGKNNYEEILHKNNFGAFFVYLQNLPSYSNDLGKIMAQEGQTKQAIDNALKNNLEHTFRKITNFSGGRPRQLILFILHRYDISNLKTALRGIFYHISEGEKIKIIICAGEWDNSFCARLCKENSLKGIIDVLLQIDTPWSSEVRSVLHQYEKERNLNEIEDALELLYFRYCISHLEKNKFDDAQILEFLRCEIDLKNILLVLKSIHSHSEPDKAHLIPQGEIPLGFILDIQKYKNIREALAALAKFYYRDFLFELSRSLPQENGILAVEKFFQKQLLHLASKLYYKSLLNIGVALGYLQMKEIEIINLRTISCGLYYGVQPHLLKEQLLLS